MCAADLDTVHSIDGTIMACEYLDGIDLWHPQLAGQALKIILHRATEVVLGEESDESTILTQTEVFDVCEGAITGINTGTCNDGAFPIVSAASVGGRYQSCVAGDMLFVELRIISAQQVSVD